MRNFEGFNEAMNDYLVGIRFNNYKEWFHENKKLYTENVHEPMVLMANELYEKMNAFDENFKETPKISRANRDIRFSKNKNPYKECKWFFLRADGKSDLVYDKPTFFFEVSPDWWRYGMFYSPCPATLARFRKKVEADTAGFRRVIECYNSQNEFTLSGDMYKRIFNKDLDDDINTWYQRKYLEFICYGDFTDDIFYKPDIVEHVFKGFVKLYPIYKYFLSV